MCSSPVPSQQEPEASLFYSALRISEPIYMTKTAEPQTPLEAAYTKFMQTAEGTPEHEQAGNELVDVLFATDGSPAVK